MNLGNRLGSISGVLEPFRGLYRAPKPTVLHWVYSASRILGHILTFSDPPSPPGQIILVQNDLKRCPTFSITCFMFDSHLSPKQHSKRSSWKRGDGLEKHERTIFLPSALVWLYERGAEKVEAISILLFQQKSFLQQGN